MCSLEKCLFRSFAHFLVRLFIFLLLSCMSSLYILDINLCQISDLQIFSPFHRLLSFYWSFPLLCRSFLFDIVPFVYFCFCFLCFDVKSKKLIDETNVEKLIPVSFFCIWLSNLPSTSFLKRLSFPHCIFLNPL